jgi:hypothetical protein
MSYKRDFSGMAIVSREEALKLGLREFFNDVKRGSTIEELRTVLRWMEAMLLPKSKISLISQGDAG